MSEPFREAWTERIVYKLTHDGVVLNLTGLTVSLVGQDRNGDTVAFTGTTGVVTAAAGTVYFDAAASDLIASHSPYRLRWKVTDGSGKSAYFPRSGPIVWDVQKP